MEEALDKVKKINEGSKTKEKEQNTVKLAETPYRFNEPYNYDNYMVVPVVSSEKRKYIPMGFIYNKDTVSTNANFIIKNADLYHFGILESIVHMAWMKVVCGRLGEGYSYSAGVVYNNFPWPEVNEKQREKIKETAQGILDARAKYPDSSLADLYYKTLMPEELRKAHEANDKAVKRAYSFKQDITEEEIFTELTKMYSKLKRKNTQREIKTN